MSPIPVPKRESCFKFELWLGNTIGHSCKLQTVKASCDQSCYRSHIRFVHHVLFKLEAIGLIRTVETLTIWCRLHRLFVFRNCRSQWGTDKVTPDNYGGSADHHWVRCRKWESRGYRLLQLGFSTTVLRRGPRHIYMWRWEVLLVICTILQCWDVPVWSQKLGWCFGQHRGRYYCGSL